MTLEIYYTPGSAPCRLVLMVAAALEIPFNLHKVDLQAEEHLKPDFLKLNPLHTLPTIVDNGFCLWESRSIARYLVNKYGEGSGRSGLYPSDPQQRALIDQRLDFDLGILSPSFGQYFHPQLFSGVPPSKEQAKKLEEALKSLDLLLEGHDYAVGTDITIADIALAAIVSTIDAAEIDLKPFANIYRWFELVKGNIPGYEQYNQKGLEEFKDLVNEVKKVRATIAAEAKKKGTPKATASK